jgi:hypothetical protein
MTIDFTREKSIHPDEGYRTTSGTPSIHYCHVVCSVRRLFDLSGNFYLTPQPHASFRGGWGVKCFLGEPSL